VQDKNIGTYFGSKMKIATKFPNIIMEENSYSYNE